MVKEVYICESCHFAYTLREEARKCEEFCTQHNGCSIKITTQSIGELKIHGK